MSDHPDRQLIEAAIAAQERLRTTLGDTIADATIAALRARLDTADPSVEHERRLVTVLFMDVVDSTRIFRDVDPEETMTIMDASLQTLAEPVQAYGGRVTRFMGDGFLAVFGLRRTRENDAEMAVRAGLGILASTRSVATDIAHRHHITGFDVRVGINTGLVVTGGVTEAEDTIMGSTVNLASRIESAAPRGSVLVSQSTYRQIRGRFDTEPAGTIDAKGFPEPIPVHLVTSERSGTEATRGIDDIDVEMIGRREELDTLLRTFEEVVDTGHGRIVTIVGEAGIGKSRLLTEFESHLPTDPQVATFRARGSLENTDVPHSLLRDLLERCFGIRSDDSAAAVRDKLATGFGAYLVEGTDHGAKIETVARFLGYNLGSPQPSDEVSSSPQQLRDRSVALLIEFFRAAGASSPVLILLDDVQWADDSSLTVLREVIEELDDRPVLTLALTRPVLWDTHAEWEQLPGHLPIAIEPLSRQQSELLIDAILSKIDDCPPELRARLLEHAEGNPYYLEELVMMCIDDGVIITDGPVWSVRRDRLAALRVPSTLTGVIRARLEGLPSREHTVLQQASVVGRVFWDEAVARIAGSSSTGTIATELHALAGRQMIEPRAQSTFSHASEYTFSHSLVRDTTYEEVLLSTRRDYHGIIADWLITASGDREGEFVGLIAGHLEKAGRAAEALDYLARAADAAWSSYAITTAADFYDRALALTRPDDLDRRYRLLLGRVKTSALQGDRDEQRRRLDELEQVAAGIGDPTKQALVDIERSYLHFYTGDYQDALAVARRAADHAAVAEDDALQSRSQTALAWASFYLEDWQTARTHGEQALTFADEGAHSEATAQNLLGMIALTTGELSEARTRLSRALHIAREGNDRDAATIYLNNLAVVLTMVGNYPDAFEHFSAVLHSAEDNGDRSAESSANVNLAWVASATGAWETARDHAQRGVSMKRRQEHREGEAEGLLWLGHALVGLGHLDEASSAYEASSAIRRELDQTALALAAEAGLARVALACGDLADATRRAERILDHLDHGESLDGTWEPLRIHLTVFETLRAVGDDRSTRVLQRAHRLLDEASGRIADPDDRRSYVEAIPWHRRLEKLAASLSD
jgi:predicted ATPase/class 3 adenylate cyclase